MLCIIYVLKNNVNSKVYVGQTWQTLESRFDNGSGYNGTAIGNAIGKHGKSNFYYEILTLCSTQETADYWEDYFIIKYNSTNKKFGYNIRGGGSRGSLNEATRRKISKARLGKFTGANNPFFGKTHKQEAIDKIIESNKRRQHSESERQKRSAHRIGKKHSQETRNKISKSNIGKHNYRHTDESRNKMKEAHKSHRKLTDQQVIEINEKYDSGRSARSLSKEYKIGKTAIWRWIKNPRKRGI